MSRKPGAIQSLAGMAPSEAQVILAHEDNTTQFKPDLVVPFHKDTRILTKEKFKELAPQMFSYVERSRAALAEIDTQQVQDGSSAPVQALRQRTPPQGELDF